VQAFASRDLMVSTLPEVETDGDGVRVVDCLGCTDDTRGNCAGCTDDTSGGCGVGGTALFRPVDDRDFIRLKEQLYKTR